MAATTLVQHADIFLVVGTSLKVYPAAGLLWYIPSVVPKFLVDPKATPEYYIRNLEIIRERATAGVKKVAESVRQSYGYS